MDLSAARESCGCTEFDPIETVQTPLEAAKILIGRGCWVFPCHPGSKIPLTTHGFKDATADVDVAEQWFRDHPTANIAIATGPSGLVVVDTDMPKPGFAFPPQWQIPSVADGLDVFAELAERHGDGRIPPTFTVRTPTGGRHMYFTAPPDTTIRCSASRLGPLLDVKAEGGYVIAPPAERTLQRAGERVGLGPGQARGTIRSGLDSGMRTGRTR